MISESRYWKEPLLKTAAILQEERWGRDERASVQVERELMLSFYAIRKLLDTFKVCDKTRNSQISVQEFPCIKSVDYLNVNRIEELYDLKKGRSANRDLLFICNQFIHSYVFEVVVDEAGIFCGVYVTSDRDRGSFLRLLSSQSVLAILKAVGNDQPREWRMNRNAKTLQWEGSVL